MARSFVRASAQYLHVSSAPVSAYPFTFACWFRTVNDAADQVFLSLSDGSTSDWWALWANTTTTNYLDFFTRVNGGTSQRASASSTISVNTWHHACGVATSATLRAVLLDGGSKGTDTNNLTPLGINATTVGRLYATPDYDYDGAIAEIGIWNAALTDGEVAVLAKGFSPPFVRPENLVFYAPSVRDKDFDIVGGLKLTAYNSPTIAAHPPRVFYPAPPMFYPPAAAAAANAVLQMMHYKRLRA